MERFNFLELNCDSFLLWPGLRQRVGEEFPFPVFMRFLANKDVSGLAIYANGENLKSLNYFKRTGSDDN